MNGTKKSVRIFSGPSVILVDVGKNVSLGRVPEALQKAEDLGSLGITVGAGLSKL